MDSVDMSSFHPEGEPYLGPLRPHSESQSRSWIAGRPDVKSLRSDTASGGRGNALTNTGTIQPSACPLIGFHCGFIDVFVTGYGRRAIAERQIITQRQVRRIRLGKFIRRDDVFDIQTFLSPFVIRS